MVSMCVGILLIIAYVVYALGGTSPASEDLKSWAVVLLIYIGICVAAGIVIQILFHIALAIGISVKEKDHDDAKIERIIKSSMLEDERDKLISLKSARIGYICSGFGFVAGLIGLAAGMQAVVVLHIIAGSFAVGSIVEGCVSVYLNERGVRNG